MAKKRAEELLPEDLTEKQKTFCREYIFDWNATRAAKVAGYSENTASEMGYENLNKPHIQAYITQIQRDLEKIAGISRLQVLQQHLKIANMSIAHLHNTWVTRKEFESLTDDQKDCIAEISTQLKTSKDSDGTLTENEYIKIKLYDKQKSLDSINKMLGYDEAQKIALSADETVKSFTIVPASNRKGVISQ